MLSIIDKRKGNERGKKVKGLYWQNNLARAATQGGEYSRFQVTGMIEGFFGV